MDKIETFAEATIAVQQHLKEFCDNTLTYPEMIAMAAMRAADKIFELREEIKAADYEIFHLSANQKDEPYY